MIAPWSRYALIGGAALLIVTGAYGLGYIDGSHSAEMDCEKAKTKAQERVTKKVTKIATKDASIAAKAEGTSEGVKHEIEGIPGADMCQSDDCLHFFNSVIAIHRSHTRGTD